MSEDVTVIKTYRLLRKEGMHPALAVIWTPLLLFMTMLIAGACRERQRKKKRVQQREQWRQEVREEEEN